MAGRVEIVKEGPLGWIVFAHPERHNAISVDMWRAIPGAVRSLSEDAAIRVIVLRGAGEDAFVSGADISEFAESRTGEAAAAYEDDNERAFVALESCEKPVLAMIHGFCVGGGVAIAATADLRYAADDASFAIPAARLGVAYPVQSLETVMSIVGASATKEIFFSARRFTAQEALTRRLVSEVKPKGDLEPFVREMAGRIAENAPLTIRAIKVAVRELGRPPSVRDDDALRAAVAACFASEDYREGVRAFLEKRRPEFRGR